MRIRKDSCAIKRCHLAPEAKDLSFERKVFQSRSPDPSLRCATFRMTYGTRIDQNPYNSFAEKGSRKNMRFAGLRKQSQSSEWSAGSRGYLCKTKPTCRIRVWGCTSRDCVGGVCRCLVLGYGLCSWPPAESVDLSISVRSPS